MSDWVVGHCCVVNRGYPFLRAGTLNAWSLCAIWTHIIKLLAILGEWESRSIIFDIICTYFVSLFLCSYCIWTEIFNLCSKFVMFYVVTLWYIAAGVIVQYRVPNSCSMHFSHAVTVRTFCIKSTQFLLICYVSIVFARWHHCAPSCKC